MRLFITGQPVRNSLKLTAMYLLPPVIASLIFGPWAALLASLAYLLSFYVVRSIVADRLGTSSRYVNPGLVLHFNCVRTAPLGWLFMLAGGTFVVAIKLWIEG